MKKAIFLSCFMLSATSLFAQQFSQYNTGTLYDSFENPSQRSFIPDSSRYVASNFFFPNLTANIFVNGNAQDVLLDRFFSGYYNTKALKVGEGKFSNIRSNTNVYLAMLKIFTSLDGNREIGFSISNKSEVRAYVTDELLALFNGSLNFTQPAYTNIFNDNYSYQVYHQFSFTYREQVSPRFALGVKLSALLGLAYSDVQIDQSQISFFQGDSAIIALRGTAYTSERLKKFTLKNPGAAITIGTGYTNRDGYRFQFNLKDLGFIRWGGESYSAKFVNGGTTIRNISSEEREKNIIDAVSGITSGNKRIKPFYTHTNAIFEASANKTYWLDYDRKFKLSPTVIASKELFYNHVTGAAVVPFSFKNFTISGTAAYNTMGVFNWGGQFMYKTPNAEFFIGSESLYQSARAVRIALRNNDDQPQVIRSRGNHSGANLFFGVAFKFGNIIEHPMNASSIPDAEPGFFSTVWHALFKKKYRNY